MSKQGYVKRATECSKITFNNVLSHIDTKQLLSNKNQLAGFYTTQVFIKSNFQTNSNLDYNKNKFSNHQTKNR